MQGVVHAGVAKCTPLEHLGIERTTGLPTLMLDVLHSGVAWDTVQSKALHLV